VVQSPAGRGRPLDEDRPVQIRTFLIADIRGYTLFTQERGDEDAAKLTARFASVVREVIERRGGSVFELRGDEALVVFDSARQAIRASVELQQRFVEETEMDPELPLTVGIGVDAGEAVVTAEGLRGGALNLAARLCGEAAAGECLATREVVHLARRVDGIRYADRGAFTFKGLTDPVGVVAVTPEDGDPALRLRTLRPPQTPPKRRRLRLAGVVGVVAAVAVVAGLVLAVRPEAPTVAGNAIGIIDLAAQELVGSVPLPGRPGDMASGEGGVWVTLPDRASVVRIDPESRSVVDTIPVGRDPAGIVSAGGSVWVTNSADGTLSRINPETGTVTQTIDVGSGPLDVAGANGSIWVVDGTDDAIVRLDPRIGEIIADIPVGDRPSAIAVGAGAIWVANFASGSVSKLDPARGEVVAEIPVGNGPLDVAAGRGRVWVANSMDGTVSVIDPSTTSVASTVPLGDGPSAVALSGSGVWVAMEFDRRVVRLEDGGDAVSEAIPIGNSPTQLVLQRGLLWLSVAPGSGAHRGGTLVSVAAAAPESIDPAVAYDIEAWEFLTTTYDGLLAFRRSGGIEGSALVPDLARSIPRPTDGSRTYSFQLRSGIRYSTGEPVRAEDFRYAIERGFAIGGPATNFFTGLVGAGDCLARPPSCDLSRGIQAEKGAVTFHLERPDPEFLQKLALPPAFAVPSGTPKRDIGSNPVPATGPYMISEYVLGERLELVRNPYFEEWSAAAQPDGFVDRIELRFGIRPGEQVDAVIEGGADRTFDQPPLEMLPELQARFPDRLQGIPQLATIYMVLNTHRPPFDDIRVRRGLNMAVDRRQVVDLYGGEALARPTCQLLPPALPGYEPYCPYTRPPGRGPSGAPNVDRARELVADSGTAGTRVTVWTSPPIPGGVAVSRYFHSLLEDLGYRTEVRQVRSADAYFDRLLGRPPDEQIALGAWVADYPAPSNFLVTLLSCDGLINYGRFCARELEGTIARASRLQATDPGAADALWAQLDREFVDRAPIVPLVNPALVDFVSDRLGNYQRHPVYGLLLSRVWVR
jgi:peptide/nickel transport system substrate-binding protein